MVSYIDDVRISSSEAYVLKFADSLMRRNSTLGGSALNVAVVCLIPVICIVDIHRPFNKIFYAARLVLACGLLYNLNKIYDNGSHFGMFLGMQRVLGILITGGGKGSFISKETESFIKSLS